MRLDLDVGEYCRKLRAEKQPPYECPFVHCGKVYKSLCGLQYHLLNVDHNTTTAANTSVCDGSPANIPIVPSGRKKSQGTAHQSRTSTADNLTPPSREGLTYSEAQKMVEFEIDNKTTRVCIYEELQVLGLEEAVAAGFNMEEMRLKKATFKQHLDENKLHLPEPSFRVIEDYSISDAPPMPNSYIRFIERSAEELDTEVEYDMDEEDCAWLSIINESRILKNLPEVPVDTFELLMDRLEKESYFQMQSSSKCGEDAAVSIIDDDAVCCICMDGECQNSNVILFCDMCNLAVHQDCYGVPYIPEGQWLCRRCLQSPSRAVDCVLCPNNGGAFKQTDRGYWAHVVCALWIPEVRFANTVFLEPIDSIEMIPTARWKLTCYICKQRGVGACIQCHKTNCYAAFHVTCAQHAGLYMKMETVRDTHGGIAIETGPVLVQKTAFCDAHTPADAETRPRLPLINRQKEFNHQHQTQQLYDHQQQQQGTPRTENNSGNETHKEDSQEKIHNARKVLAKKRSSVPIISIPTIPPERIQDIASHVTLTKKSQFIQRLIAYWTLKRQMRNGVPLLRRLQISHLSRRGDFHPQQEVGELYRQLKYWQRLRQDLERARLLCELVRKREKLKNELCKIKEKSLELELQPCICFLRQLWEIVQAKDTGDIFQEPVDQTEVLDYADVVKQPMDLSTMKMKLESYQYPDLWSFEADFKLMIQNCMAYNSRDSIFYKAAVKLRDQCAPLFRMAEHDFVTSSFELANDVLQIVGEDAKIKSLNETSNSNTKTDVLNKQSDLGDLSQSCVSSEMLATMKNDRSLPSTEPTNGVEGSVNHVHILSDDLTRTRHTRAFKVEMGKNQCKMGSTSIDTHKDSSSGEGGFESDSEHEETTDDENEKKVISRRHNSASGKVTSTGISTPARRLTRLFAKDVAKLSSQPESSPSVAAFEPVQTTSVQSSSVKTISPTGVNRRTAVLFTRKAAAAAFRKPEPAVLANNTNVTSGSNGTPVVNKRRVGRPRKNPSTNISCVPHCPSPVIPLPVISSSESSLNSACPLPCSESFRVYRSGGDIPGETDDDTQSDSSCSSCSTTDDSSGSSGDSSSFDLAHQTGAESSAEDDSAINSQGSVHKLEPLDLVWAKCRGYPWYPALIINPKMPRTGYLHNGVPIPAPPLEVLALAANYRDPVYLVLFFDTKRTWQWLPRNKLEPLGVLLEVDQAKLVESRKPTDRKAVRKAYQEALHHHCQVTGVNTVSEQGSAMRKNKLPDSGSEHT